MLPDPASFVDCLCQRYLSTPPECFGDLIELMLISESAVFLDGSAPGSFKGLSVTDIVMIPAGPGIGKYERFRKASHEWGHYLTGRHLGLHDSESTYPEAGSEDVKNFKEAVAIEFEKRCADCYVSQSDYRNIRENR